MRERRWTRWAWGWAVLGSLISLGASVAGAGEERVVTRIAFGSCANQSAPQPIWDAIVKFDPQVFIWLGDNIYGDIRRPIQLFGKERTIGPWKNVPRFVPSSEQEMESRYETAKANPGYSRLQQNAKVIGTWDDHDYGLNDAGKEFGGKITNQRLLLDFLDEPKDSPRRKQAGVYASYAFGPVGKQVKVILLDTRYHRDPLFSDGSILGLEQWTWLEKELMGPTTELTIIGSSIQVISNHSATTGPLFYLEAWGRFPKERDRLFKLIAESKRGGVFFISGDVHFGEIARYDCGVGYPLFDITSSGLTQAVEEAVPPPANIVVRFVAWLIPSTMRVMGSNCRFRSCTFGQPNFGAIEILWGEKSVKLIIQVRDVYGHPVTSVNVSLSELRAHNGILAAADTAGGYRRHCSLEVTLPWIVRYRLAILFYCTVAGMELLIKPVHYDRGTYNPFFFSPNRNTLIGDGCGIFTYVSNIKASLFKGGCFSLCQGQRRFGLPPNVHHARKCLGFECCEAAVPPGLKSLSVRMFCIDNSSDYRNPPRCSRAFIAEKKLSRAKYDHPEIPMVLSWVFGNATCEPDQRRGNTSFGGDCSTNAHCVDFVGRGHRCKCNTGYDGNPYLPHGCLDINECDGPKNSCADERVCINTEGGYYCSSDGNHSNGGATPLDMVLHVAGIGLTIVVTLAIGIWFAWALSRTRRAKLKKAFFKRNGGLLFQQIASQEGAIVKTEIFTSEELQRASDNFSESRMCGKGGFGTVYKGMLSDGRIVAIKKSHLTHEKQVGQFINEVVILSEINHRNVVKLLGCCLETEVPLLVYEIISNETLSRHLHGEDRCPCLSWKVRINIALEIAGALAYLHSATSMPIFHRDVKSSNILLDNNYSAKISDFGISRSISLEKTLLTTGLQGTFSYLDPEYFHSRQFTDKSDVYSFGVVPLELLTGERAVSRSKVEVEEKSLALNSILAMKENSLHDILDDMDPARSHRRGVLGLREAREEVSQIEREEAAGHERSRRRSREDRQTIINL